MAYHVKEYKFIDVMKEYRCYVEWLSIVVRRVSSYACKSLVTLNVGVVVSEHVMTVDLQML